MSNSLYNRRKDHLNDDMHVKFFRIKSNAFIKCSSLAIIKVHGHIYLTNNKTINGINNRSSNLENLIRKSRRGEDRELEFYRKAEKACP